MAFLTRLVYLLIVLSIAADLLSLRDYLLSTGRRDGDPTAVQSSLFVPGASAIGPIVRALTKSAIKALKKKAKAAAKKAGNARKKGRKEHTKNARKSTKNKHQKGQARQQREQSKSNKKKG
mmetsp:Transcript_15105/g.24763  ORF Transcript_15105/g.24763 Transcript_15105/m.24763 type:complete len:121 (+) Transcript_15105:67-429(+)